MSRCRGCFNAEAVAMKQEMSNPAEESVERIEDTRESLDKGMQNCNLNIVPVVGG